MKQLPTVECCEIKAVHGENVAKAKAEQPQAEQLSKLANLFKMFGDPTRVRIIYALLSCELCVCDLAAVLAMTSTTVSHQLRLLKQNDLVKSRRDGKTVYYSLADDHVKLIVDQGFTHICESFKKER